MTTNRTTNSSAEETEAEVTNLMASNHVGQYLRFLQNHKPDPTKRQPSRDSIEKRITIAEERCKKLDGVALILKMQQISDLKKMLGSMADDVMPYEAKFIRYGKQFADYNGVEYATFRMFGVPADILKKAGIKQ